jgi:hypothetical protein
MNKAAMIRGLFVGGGNGGRHKWRPYEDVGCAFMRTWCKTAMKLSTGDRKGQPEEQSVRAIDGEADLHGCRVSLRSGWPFLAFAPIQKPQSKPGGHKWPPYKLRG